MRARRVILCRQLRTLEQQRRAGVLIARVRDRLVEHLTRRTRAFDPFDAAAPVQFIAILDGILNTTTWSVVMNGTVTEDNTGRGLLGARVHEEGQLIGFDEETGVTTFQGTITILR